jgi:hypothetical protein
MDIIQVLNHMSTHFHHIFNYLWKSVNICVSITINFLEQKEKKQVNAKSQLYIVQIQRYYCKALHIT